MIGWFWTWGRSVDYPMTPATISAIKPTLTTVLPEAVNRTDPVLIPATKWPAIRRRAQSPAWHAAMQQLREDVADLLAQPWDVPTAPAGHFHQYFCPDHGVKLAFDPQSPTVHRCPVDGAVLRGQTYDDAWRWFVNNRLSQGALQLAMLWQLEGNPAHAARVVDILKSYANHYTGYQTFPRRNPRPGIATFQALDEAVWLIPLAWAFDLTRDWMMAADAQTIIQQLLLPAANFLIERHPRRIHNYSCWHNAAIATVGVVTERRDLV
ncbi:MAG: hypothetical protein KDE31_27285, partial [Caldilineaceae bacterium]|nr:hypothetical protein [Caldilineaceae bacterium]